MTKFYWFGQDDQNLITEQIEKSAVVDQEEDLHDVAVNWGLTEAQALAKLRIKNVPSPIKRDYKWTGKLTPLPTRKKPLLF